MTQIVNTFTLLQRMARRLPEQRGGSPARELTSEEKSIARHMAWDNATAAQIGKAIGWPASLEGLRTRLRAINIRTNGTRRKFTEVRR